MKLDLSKLIANASANANANSKPPTTPPAAPKPSATNQMQKLAIDLSKLTDATGRLQSKPDPKPAIQPKPGTKLEQAIDDINKQLPNMTEPVTDRDDLLLLLRLREHERITASFESCSFCEGKEECPTCDEELDRELDEAMLQLTTKFNEDYPEEAPTKQPAVVTDVVVTDESTLVKTDEQPKPSKPQLQLSDLDPSQLAAIDLLASYSRAVLVGSAGTGKSTTVDFFIDRIYDTVSHIPFGQLTGRKLSDNATAEETARHMQLTPSIAVVAYTGIATQRVANKLRPELQRNCMTIHKLLGYYPEMEEYFDVETSEVAMRQIFVPAFTKHNPLRWDVIIIDEAGMPPADLWNNLCAALLPTTRVYLVGDLAQLTPIMGTSPLSIAMNDLPTAELTKVHRTENDWITQEAQRIRNGIMPDFATPVTKYMELDPYPDRAASQIVAGVVGLFKQGKFDPRQDIIITATNVNDLGQEALNRKLCRHFNPDEEQVKINAIISRPRYAVGDKIMITKNDDTQGLSNGMIGYITDIIPNPDYKGKARVNFDKLNDVFDAAVEDAIATAAAQENAKSQPMQASHIVTAHFPECYAEDEANHFVKFKTGNHYSNIQHAYAITCHKAQGGEFRQVVIIAHSSGGRMLNREWFYTAWTRTRRNVIVLANISGLNKCLNNQQLKGKTLKEKVAYVQQKIEHKLRQARKSNNKDATGKILNAIPQKLTTEKL